MREKSVKVTTTNNFENAEIIKYLEPITAHIVIGMNIFSDFNSSITDFFGGHSSSYETKLSNMNTQAIDLLKRKAHKMGANCVVGLNIDNDEISAQGKSMLMVSAFGTAAIGKFKEIKAIDLSLKNKGVVSKEQFDILQKKNEFIRLADIGKLKISIEDWAFIKAYKIQELYEYALDSFIEYTSSMTAFLDSVNQHKNNLIEYTMLLDSDFVTDFLYKKLELDISSMSRNQLTDIIEKTNLIDYDKIFKLIENDSFVLKQNGVRLCSFSKLEYIYDDIEKIKLILNYIENNFKERGVKSKKKKAFVSKDIEIWNCECGKENSIYDIYCKKCHNDIYGFKENAITPSMLAELLECKIEILEESFKIR